VAQRLSRRAGRTHYMRQLRTSGGQRDFGRLPRRGAYLLSAVMCEGALAGRSAAGGPPARAWGAFHGRSRCGSVDPEPPRLEVARRQSGVTASGGGRCGPGPRRRVRQTAGRVARPAASPPSCWCPVPERGPRTAVSSLVPAARLSPFGRLQLAVGAVELDRMECRALGVRHHPTGDGRRSGRRVKAGERALTR
jgi:hypothetical protein